MKFEPITGREYAANFMIAIHRALTMQLYFAKALCVAGQALDRDIALRSRFSAPLRFDRQSGPVWAGECGWKSGWVGGSADGARERS